MSRDHCNSSLQGEREREEQYFDYLEKKENIEEKMASVKELRVNVVQCKIVSNIMQDALELRFWLTIIIHVNGCTLVLKARHLGGSAFCNFYRLGEHE